MRMRNTQTNPTQSTDKARSSTAQSTQHELLVNVIKLNDTSKADENKSINTNFNHRKRNTLNVEDVVCIARV